MQRKKETSAHKQRFAHLVSVCRKFDNIFSLSASVLSCSQSAVTRMGATRKYTPIAQKTGNTRKHREPFIRAKHSKQIRTESVLEHLPSNIIGLRIRWSIYGEFFAIPIRGVRRWRTGLTRWPGWLLLLSTHPLPATTEEVCQGIVLLLPPRVRKSGWWRQNGGCR